MSSFYYVLELSGGGSADPMFFTALDGSQVGDSFLACSELQRVRILAIGTEAPGVLAGHADASRQGVGGPALLPGEK